MLGFNVVSGLVRWRPSLGVCVLAVALSLGVATTVHTDDGARAAPPNSRGAEPRHATASPAASPRSTGRRLSNPRWLNYLERDRRAWRALAWSERLWRLSPGTLRNCAATEGGFGPTFPVGAAGEHGPMQFMATTFTWMKNSTVRDLRRRGKNLPLRYRHRDSVVGQAVVAGWAFRHGLRGHWFGVGC